MINIKPNRKLSVTSILTISFLIIIIAQILLIFFNFKILRIDYKMKRLVYDNMIVKSEETSQKLENEILNSWANELYMGETIWLSEKIYKDKSKINAELVEDMIGMMDAMRVEEAFLIVDDKTYETSNIVDLIDEDTKKRPRDNSDITMLTGSEKLKRETNLVISSEWTPKYSEYSSKKDLYESEYKKAKEYVTNGHSGGFWSYKKANDVDKFMDMYYTKPLVDEDSKFYGIITVKVFPDRLAEILNHKNLEKLGEGAYILASLPDENGNYKIINLYGSYMRSMLRDDLSTEKDGVYLKLDEIKNEYYEPATDNQDSKQLYVVHGQKGTIMLRKEIVMNNATEDKDEMQGSKLMLFTAMQERDISYTFNNFFMYLIEVILISFLLGLVVIYILSISLTLPIKKLSRNIEQMIYDDDVNYIERLNIIELDNLVDVIDGLSNKLVENSKRFQVIMDQTSIPIVAIEKNDNKDEVSKLGMISNIFAGFIENEIMNETWSVEEYEKFNEKLFKNASLVDSLYDMEKDKQADIYKKNWNGKNTYFKITTKRIENENNEMSNFDEQYDTDLQFIVTSKTLQVIEDCTREITEKIKIRKERDYDVLTGLLNRFSFKKLVEDFIKQDSMKTRKAAMIMWDLDNLKYVNDTYGHDIGDKYIQSAANIINLIKEKRPQYTAYVARVSGDEFFALVEYNNSQDEIRTLVDEVRQEMIMSKLNVNEDLNIKIRGTTGICWYPEDATTYEELHKFADFAMYSGKLTNKGTISEFSKEQYERDYILLSGNEDINKFIEEREVKYAFQPIVSTKDGSVYAYESLMRSTSDNIKSVEDVLRLAKDQSKFTEIEILTFEEVLKTVSENIDKLEGKKIFINSISSTMLPTININILYNKYAELLTNLVIELTESEDFSKEFLDKKKNMKENFGCMMAIDDFGTGYATDSWLLEVSPDFLKVDMNLIRDIDKDVGRRALVQNILKYSKEKNIKTIAEGVETYAELETLIDMGVDYIQGYYLGKPQFEILDIPEDKKREIQVLYSLKNM